MTSVLDREAEPGSTEEDKKVGPYEINIPAERLAFARVSSGASVSDGSYFALELAEGVYYFSPSAGALNALWAVLRRARESGT